MIDAVAIDLGGVAARFRPERRLHALASLTGTAESALQERLFNSGLERRAELGDYSPEQVQKAIRAALAHPVPLAAIIEAWALAFEPDAEVLQFIAALPARTSLFTNNGPMIDACLAGPLRGVARVFDEVVCSWHIQAVKPERVAFERVAKRLCVSPEKLLLLDDDAENVKAARRCGWLAERVTELQDMREAIGGYLDV